MSTLRSANIFGRLLRRPLVSVVVVVHNIPQQARRTLLSLSRDYQRHVGHDDYEVIVVDNGSTPPVDLATLADLNEPFRVIRMPSPASPSPARAVNCGLAAARGDVIGVMIDGARLVTPGLLHFAYHGVQLYEKAVVATLGWYLGADLQRWSMQAGHDAHYETQLLDSINWPADGYRLFEIATLDESSVDGWVQPIAESNALFMRRAMWDAIGGFDERFDLPGGGLLNLHVMRQTLELPGSRLVVLAGEGTFHQFHGGVATNTPAEEFAAHFAPWLQQYETIAGRKWQPAVLADPPTYIGIVPPPALTHFARATLHPMTGTQTNAGLDAPLEADEEQRDPGMAGVVALALAELAAGRHAAAAAVARLGRQRMPDNPYLLRVLAMAGPALPFGNFPNDANPAVHLALAKAHQLLGARQPGTGATRPSGE